MTSIHPPIGPAKADPTSGMPAPHPDAPNVVVILLDDVGFGHLGCYGSDIATPHIDALAARGRVFNNFHTTALCAPTRASLLTGRNHHDVGMGMLPEFASDSPGYQGEIPVTVPTVAELLRVGGYTTVAVGKWHLVPLQQQGPTGPFHQWPTSRGFDHYYGFINAGTDQFAPDLVRGTERVEPPATPEAYHLTEDLVNEATKHIGSSLSASPDRPFFLYFAPGAAHSPLQAPAEYIDAYQGAFDEGWDVCRERVYQRQLAMGIIPEGTDLVPRNPGIEPWESLPADVRKVYARLQEVFAGFLSHTDAQIGRLVEFIDSVGQLDNTVFVLTSDNGASQEGGVNGRSEMFFVTHVDFDATELLPELERLGGPDHHCHYPQGWAQVGNTPLKRYKQNTHGGGVKDPLIVAGPNFDGTGDQVISEFTYITDIAPTVFDLARVPCERPEFHGRSLLDMTRPDHEPTPRVQYFEMWGNRGIYLNGWKAVAYHERGKQFEDDVWELYDLDNDFSECHDLAGENPALLKTLRDLWWEEAERYNVLPIDDRLDGRRLQRLIEWRKGLPQETVYRPGFRTAGMLAPGVPQFPTDVTARTSFCPGDEGVLAALGGRFAGWTLFVLDDKLHFVYRYYLHDEVVIRGEAPIPSGATRLGFRAEPISDRTVRLTLVIDGQDGAASTFDFVPFMTGLEPFEIGRDGYSSVSSLYEAPFAFTGNLRDVTTCTGPADVSRADDEAEAVFASQ